MVETRGQLGAQVRVLYHHGFGNLLERGEMTGCIPVTPGMVGDESAALPEQVQQGQKRGIGGHGLRMR